MDHNVLSKIKAIIDRVEAWFASDVRDVRASIEDIESRLTSELSDVRAEAEAREKRLREDIEDTVRNESAALVQEIARLREELRQTLAEHREAIRHLDMSKRTVPNVIGEKPSVLQ